MRASCLAFLAALCFDSLLLGADPSDKTVLVIHGGAGVLTAKELKESCLRNEDFEQGLAEALRAGFKSRVNGKTSVEVVEAAIRVMEDSPLFNAGRGAAFTEDGRFELDAAIMEGSMQGAGKGKQDSRKRAGAVAGVTHIKNPISAARAVMEMQGSRHVLLVGDGAEQFALSDVNQKRYGIEKVSNTYFWTNRSLKQFQEKMIGKPSKGTVGAVAISDDGRLAVGTSTGGLTGKLPGRVGDSPIIGAGTYADDRACGVSCTGTGEVFIRHAVAHDVVARMLYANIGVEAATQEAINQLPDEDEGVGGLIALDKNGRHAFIMSQKSLGMYRGYVTDKGDAYVAIEAIGPFKLIKRIEGGER
jgi:beta-aspartyl-peptidase (threonine type)